MLNPPPPKKKEQFANTQNLKFHNSLCNFGRDLDSRLLCNAMGHPGWQKIPMAKVVVCLLKKKKTVITLVKVAVFGKYLNLF